MAELIGYIALGIVIAAIVGLAAGFTIRRASSQPGRHRDSGEQHEGAGSEGHVAELHQLGVDPLVSLLHRSGCVLLAEHVAPIGFDAGEPVWTGEHGESDNPDAVAGQCMCGHPNYLTCPDWLGGWEPSVACSAERHNDCTTAGADTATGRLHFGTCVCDCHALLLSIAVKRYRAELNQLLRDWRRDRRDLWGG